MHQRAAALSLGAAALLLALLGAACDGGNGSPPPAGTSPTATTARPTPAVGREDLPPRNYVDLARRLMGVSGAVELEAPPRDALPVGYRRTFKVLRLPAPGENREVPPTLDTIEATLRLVTEHGYIFVQDGQDVDEDDIAAAGEALEKVLPTVEVFAPLPPPGVDGDSRIVVLHARLPNLGGYVTDADFYPTTVAPASNVGEGVYLNLSLLRDHAMYASILAHELQHLVHFSADPDDEVWVQEGLSQVAAILAEGVGTASGDFSVAPDTQLNVWDPTGQSIANYGAAEVFFRYLLARAGGDESVLGELVAEQADGMDGVEAVLQSRLPGVTFDDLFADFVTANFADAPEGPYGYPDLNLEPSLAATLTAPREESGTVHQFAADYIAVELPEGDATFSFEGDTSVSVLGNEAHSGRGQWWSNRGDGIDTTLTAPLDLRDVSAATLTFWTWFDIESWYDYGYVEVSVDDGRTWTALAGQHTSDEDPLGQSYGPGYTGVSGGGDDPAWVEEQIDLSAYAGQEVLIRFEYVTDGAVNTAGWAIDDLAVPEVGFVDGAEDGGGWTADGFLRIDAPLPQRFVLRLIEYTPEPTVTDIPLDADNRAQVSLRGFGGDLERAVIVIAGLTRGTGEPARYRYSLLAEATAGP